MNSQISIFNHPEFGKIRGMKDENGEPWFVGKDVACALGYANPSNALNVHVEKEDKTSYLIRVSGSNYKAIRDHVEDEDKTLNESFTVNGTIPILINESGLYSLIFSSKLDKAREFKRWELGVINYEL